MRGNSKAFDDSRGVARFSVRTTNAEREWSRAAAKRTRLRCDSVELQQISNSILEMDLELTCRYMPDSNDSNVSTAIDPLRGSPLRICQTRCALLGATAWHSFQPANSSTSSSRLTLLDALTRPTKNSESLASSLVAKSLCSCNRSSNVLAAGLLSSPRTMFPCAL